MSTSPPLLLLLLAHDGIITAFFLLLICHSRSTRGDLRQMSAAGEAAATLIYTPGCVLACIIASVLMVSHLIGSVSLYIFFCL